MNEWTIVGVIVVLVGLFFTVGKPVIKLNGSITSLNVKLEHMQSDNAKYETRNAESHARIFTHLEDNDAKLSNHELRIGILEHDKQ